MCVGFTISVNCLQSWKRVCTIFVPRENDVVNVCKILGCCTLMPKLFFPLTVSNHSVRLFDLI